MGFFEAIGSVFNNYFSFSGRALRSEYWYFMLFSWLVFIMATILDETVFYSSNIDIYGPVDLAATVVLFIPSLSVASFVRPGFILSFFLLSLCCLLGEGPGGLIGIICSHILTKR